MEAVTRDILAASRRTQEMKLTVTAVPSWPSPGLSMTLPLGDDGQACPGSLPALLRVAKRDPNPMKDLVTGCTTTSLALQTK